MKAIRYFMVAVLGLGLSYTAHAEENADQKESLFGTEQLPTAGTFKLNESLDDGEGVEFTYGVDASFVAHFVEDAADEEALRSEIYVTLGLDIPLGDEVLRKISILGGFSFQDATSDAAEDDWNGTYSNGLTDIQARDVFNKLLVVADILAKEGKGDSRIPVYAVRAKAGRYQVDQVGSFIPNELQITDSILTPYRLEQQDAVGVEVAFRNGGENTAGDPTVTTIGVNFHGFDFFGYSVDALEDVEQDGEGSFTINASHAMALGGNDIELKFSYSRIEEGVYYTRALPDDQIGENQTFAAGIKWSRDMEDLGTLIVAAEGLYIDPDTDAIDEIWAAEVIAALELENIPVTPFAGLAVLDRDNSTDLMPSVGAALRLLPGVTLTAMAQFAMRDQGEDSTNFAVGMTLTNPEKRYVQVRSE